MQKCSSSADKKINKNQEKKIEKTAACDGFSCRPVYDLSSEQLKENNTSRQMLNINLLTDESEKD